MKRRISFLATVFFLLVLSGSPVFADTYSWSLNSLGDDYYYTQGVNGAFWGSGYYTVDGTATGTPLYDINYATKLVDGTGNLESTGTSGSGGQNYNKWIDGADTRNWGTGALGIPDMVYNPGDGSEMSGIATGFSPKNLSTNYMTYGFDAALDYTKSLYVYYLGWGGTEHVYVSSDSTYTSDAAMAWIDLGTLAGTTQPSTWGVGGTAPYQEYTAAMLAAAGVADDINFVKFSGNGKWIDAVGGTAVPIPGAIWLLGSGILSLIGIKRKQR
jgi:hypothetical protein